MFFALQLDRGNITQALTDNMLSESTDHKLGLDILIGISRGLTFEHK